MAITYDWMFIGGEWVPPSSTARIDVISSSTEEVIGSVPEAQEADVDAAGRGLGPEAITAYQQLKSIYT